MYHITSQWLLDDANALELENDADASLGDDTLELENDADALESAFFVPFSKGSRMCLGHNLAWCELYLVLASIFRKTKIRIHDTSEDDFEYRQYWMPIFRGRQLQGFVQRMED
ncbi:hypothetical protein FB107DRAFT_272694 [Schizophyllum commune]